jgi:hypothetical protein
VVSIGPTGFGAEKQNLEIIERRSIKKARTIGETQISRFRDGGRLLLKNGTHCPSGPQGY